MLPKDGSWKNVGSSHKTEPHVGPENHGLEARVPSECAPADTCGASERFRHGAYLPHWTRDSAVYSITFRLHDSLPQSLVEAWVEERTSIVQTAQQLGRPLSEWEEERLQYLFSDKVDRYLDGGHGQSWMRDDRIARTVAQTIRHFDGTRYRLFAWCVMPNHVHAVLEPQATTSLERILHSWKSYSANQANRLLGRSGPFWQPEYYDHLVRNGEDLAHSVEYVLRNPVQARLRNWRWLGGGTGFQPVGTGDDAPFPRAEPTSKD